MGEWLLVQFDNLNGCGMAGGGAGHGGNASARGVGIGRGSGVPGEPNDQENMDLDIGGGVIHSGNAIVPVARKRLIGDDGLVIGKTTIPSTTPTWLRE